MHHSMTPRWFTAQGNRFFARTWGDAAKPALLLLHGFPEHSGAWEELAQHLAPHYYCVAPDQRGYGDSYCPQEVSEYRTSLLAADMAHILTELGAPCAVLGHDWGAATAYGLAMFHPELVSRLIVLNGVHPVPFQRAMASGGAQSRASQYILRLRDPQAETWLSANHYDKLLSLFSADMDMSWLTGAKRDAYIAQWDKPGRLTGMLNWYRASPLQVAEPGKPIANLPNLDPARLQIQCPHLVIWGQNDTALLPESREGLEAFAPNLILREIKEADHWLHHQVPATVAEHILDWMPLSP